MNSDDGHKSGFSLIEAAIVLGVVGLVIGGIWVAAAAVNESHKQSVILSEIGQIVRNVQMKFPRNGDAMGSDIYFSAQTGCSATCLGKDLWGPYIPAEMIQSGQVQPVGPWQNSTIGVNIRPSLGLLVIMLGGVPESSCVKLAPRLYAAFAKDFHSSYSLHVRNWDGYDIDTPSSAAVGCYNSSEPGYIDMYLKF